MTYEDSMAVIGRSADQEIADERAKGAVYLATIDALRAELEDCRNPTPEPRTMRVGSSLWRDAGETLLAAYDRREATWGVAPEAVRIFLEGGPDTAPNIPGPRVISFKGDPGAVLSGDHDPGMERLIGTMRVSDRWAYWHEPEDDVEAGRFTAEDWRQAFEHLMVVADRRASCGPILQQWTLDPASRRDFNDYVVPNATFYGWDVYTAHQWIGAAYSRCATATTQLPGSPRWMVCEAGLKNPNAYTAAQTAEYVTAASRIARDLDARVWLYYDALMRDRQGHPTFDFRLNTDTEWAAMREAILAA